MTGGRTTAACCSVLRILNLVQLSTTTIEAAAVEYVEYRTIQQCCGPLFSAGSAQNNQWGSMVVLSLLSPLRHPAASASPLLAIPIGEEAAHVFLGSSLPRRSPSLPIEFLAAGCSCPLQNRFSKATAFQDASCSTYYLPKVCNGGTVTCLYMLYPEKGMQPRRFDALHVHGIATRGRSPPAFSNGGHVGLLPGLRDKFRYTFIAKFYRVLPIIEHYY